ncbi:MAG: LrgB family protein [Burkholderiaceae bacterium]|nr:LrgB family protein [Burkholderiaceae bacterium]
MKSIDALADIELREIWVYLTGSPLLSLILTLLAYQVGLMIYERMNKNPLANPVAIAIAIVITTISVLGMPYAQYFEGAQFIHFLLGTATVALAVPIYKGWQRFRQRAGLLSLALVVGGSVSILSAVGMATLMGLPRELVMPFYAKSVTAPIAMGIAENIGASPTLTAVYAVSTGIIGAIVARMILDGLSMRAWWQRGFAIGVGAHGIGTSRAFSVNAEAGAFASIGMGLHGILGAILIPWLS